MLWATTSVSLSKPLEVYAVDNCDATSTCTNTQTGVDNTQTNDCTTFSTCENEAIGDGNIQSNRCDSAAGSEFFPGCDNFIEGNDNSQSKNCTDFSLAVTLYWVIAIVKVLTVPLLQGASSFLRAQIRQEVIRISEYNL